MDFAFAEMNRRWKIEDGRWNATDEGLSEIDFGWAETD
jgi:hypothetical protein